MQQEDKSSVRLQCQDHLCDDGVVDDAALLIGEHAQRAEPVRDASNIAHHQRLQERHRVFTLHITSDHQYQPLEIGHFIGQECSRDMHNTLARLRGCN